MIRSIEDIKKEGSHLEGDCGNPSDTPPEWLDIDKFQRGQEFFKKHLCSFIIMLHVSLIVGFSLINLLDPLVFTDQSNTPSKAFSRYEATFFHIALWHFGNVWEAPGGASHKSVLLVRSMHNKVMRSMRKVNSDKVHLSQYDMALVQSGFFGGIVNHAEAFGVKCTDDELDDYVHFWRGIGYLLGINDQFNLCSNGLVTTRKLLKEIEHKLVLPALANPPANFASMTDAYVQGTNPRIIPLWSKEAVIAFSYEQVNYPVPNLTFPDKLRMIYIKSTIWLIRWFPGFARIFNYILITFVERVLKSFSKTLK